MAPVAPKKYKLRSLTEQLNHLASESVGRGEEWLRNRFEGFHWSIEDRYVKIHQENQRLRDENEKLKEENATLHQQKIDMLVARGGDDADTGLSHQERVKLAQDKIDHIVNHYSDQDMVPEAADVQDKIDQIIRQSGGAVQTSSPSTGGTPPPAAAEPEEAKRRKEQEAREEAAKQERLKAKLAALEGAGKSRSERAAEATAAGLETNRYIKPDKPELFPMPRALPLLSSSPPAARVKRELETDMSPPRHRDHPYQRERYDEAWSPKHSRKRQRMSSAKIRPLPVCRLCFAHKKACDGDKECEQCIKKGASCRYQECSYGDDCIIEDCQRLHPEHKATWGLPSWDLQESRHGRLDRAHGS